MRGLHLMRGALGLVLVFSSVPGVRAQIQNGNQLPGPRLFTLNPCGARPGTNLEVAFTGTELDGPEALIFSHPGIQAKPIVPPPPMVDPKAKPDPNKKPAPPAPITKFAVAIAKDVPAGFYEARFVGKYGLSNTRLFVVENLEQAVEKEPNNDVEQAQKIEVGSTVQGSIAAAADVDYYAFTARKGQRVLIHCQGASIDSRIFPEIRVFNAAQRPLIYHRPLPYQDGVTDLVVPEDGEYILRLNQFTYTVPAGAADHYFYRLTLSTGPWIDAVFPPVVEPGKPTKVTLYGRNLPGGQLDPTAILDNKPLEKLTVTVDPPKDPQAAQKLEFSSQVTPTLGVLDGFEYRLQTPAGPSNPVFFTFAQAPVVLENDDNDTADKAQDLKIPCEVAGRIDKKRDRDWYAFEAKKGDVVVVEVLSHRLGAPTDMYFSLRKIDIKNEYILQDDTLETMSTKGYYTANKDPQPYRFVVPTDGKYHVMVASHVGDIITDPQHVYRLRISPEQPDFRLVAMPAEDYRPDCCNLGKGGVDYFLVYAQRRDGFKGDITLELEGLPTGVASPPQILAGNQKFAMVALTASDNASAFLGPIKVKGTAVIQGQKVVREARAASITWPTAPQQNTATITRLDRSLMLSIREKAVGKLQAGTDKVVVSMGDKFEIPLKLTRTLPEFKGAFTVGPVQGDLPQGLTFGNLTFAPGKDEQKAAFTLQATTPPPGTYNLVLRGFAKIPMEAQPKAKEINGILASTPVQLTILPKQVATLTVDKTNPTIKAGKEEVLLVKVNRQFDYADAFKVVLEFPKEVKDLTAEPATIGPGQNEVKLTVRVPPDAKPGPRANLVLKAVATVHGNVTLNHELKLNINVAPADQPKK